MLFHFVLLLFLICLIRTLFTNPGYYNKEYCGLYSITKFLKLLFYFVINKDNISFDLKKCFIDFTKNDQLNKEINLINKNNDVKKELKELYELQSKMPENLLKDISISCSNISSMDSQHDIFNEIEEYNKEAKEVKDQNNPNLEDDIIKFDTEYRRVLNSNVDYKKYMQLSFYLINKDNQRICGYCLIQKVIISKLKYSQIERDTVDIVAHVYENWIITVFIYTHASDMEITNFSF